MLQTKRLGQRAAPKPNGDFARSRLFAYILVRVFCTSPLRSSGHVEIRHHRVRTLQPGSEGMTQTVSRFSASSLSIGQVAPASGFWGIVRGIFSNIVYQFVVIVLAPTLLASLYYGLIASRQYVSHSEYIVRGVDSHRSAGISALLNTFGISRAADETSAIESFLKSRDLVSKLNARVNLRAVYSTDKADRLSRYPRFWQSDTFESLYTYMQDFILVTQDPTTGVTKLDISAFDPDKAKLIADNMLALASDMSNSLNKTAQIDTVDTADKEVASARENVVSTQKELTELRNRELLLDPLSFAAQVLQGIAKLSLDRAEIETQIDQSERLSPTNPSLPALKARQEALEDKIHDERSELAGGNAALADKMGAYDHLTLLRTLADKRYGSALLSLQAAQADAERKRVYIEGIVEPNLPDDDTRPERIRNILSVFVITFMAYSILWILSVGSKDHAQ